MYFLNLGVKGSRPVTMCRNQKQDLHSIIFRTKGRLPPQAAASPTSGHRGHFLSTLGAINRNVKACHSEFPFNKLTDPLLLSLSLAVKVQTKKKFGLLILWKFGHSVELSCTLRRDPCLFWGCASRCISEIFSKHNSLGRLFCSDVCYEDTTVSEWTTLSNSSRALLSFSFSPFIHFFVFFFHPSSHFPLLLPTNFIRLWLRGYKASSCKFIQAVLSFGCTATN